MGKGLVVGVVVGMFVGCEREQLGIPAVAVTDSALTSASSGNGDKPIGADCTAGRQSDCASRRCVKSNFEFDGGYYCTRECKTGAECPAHWACVEAMPGPHGRICVAVKRIMLDGGTR
jgi:hypothetical protein